MSRGTLESLPTAATTGRNSRPEKTPFPGSPLPLELPELPRNAPAPARPFARPRYSEQFACIASACEDTCCRGWGVPVDRATYEKYESHAVLKKHLGTLIVLNEGSFTTSDYARMPLTTNGTCGFLDEKRMCGIQKAHGVEMLSHTCQTYPRALSIQRGEVERALNLSCPEAARITLLNPALLEGDEWQQTGADRYKAMRDWAREPLKAEDAGQTVRQFCLLVLSDRNYELWQRVYLLGIFVRRLEVLAGDLGVADWCQSDPLAVESLLSDGARVAAAGLLRESMDSLVPRPAEQLQFVAAMLRLRVQGPPMPARFIQCVQEFEAGLGCNTSREASILASYAEGRERYYAPLMRQHPHLLENYLINQVFKNNFPFGSRGTTTSAVAEHLALTVHLAAAQSLLIGMAQHHRENFSVDHVVMLIQSLAKTVEHGKAYLEQVAAFVIEKGLDNLRGVALLVRQDV